MHSFYSPSSVSPHPSIVSSARLQSQHVYYYPFRKSRNPIVSLWNQDGVGLIIRIIQKYSHSNVKPISRTGRHETILLSRFKAWNISMTSCRAIFDAKCQYDWGGEGLLSKEQENTTRGQQRISCKSKFAYYCLANASPAKQCLPDWSRLYIPWIWSCKKCLYREAGW